MVELPVCIPGSWRMCWHQCCVCVCVCVLVCVCVGVCVCWCVCVLVCVFKLHSSGIMRRPTDASPSDFLVVLHTLGEKRVPPLMSHLSSPASLS